MCSIDEHSRRHRSQYSVLCGRHSSLNFEGWILEGEPTAGVVQNGHARIRTAQNICVCGWNVAPRTAGSAVEQLLTAFRGRMSLTRGSSRFRVACVIMRVSKQHSNDCKERSEPSRLQRKERAKRRTRGVSASRYFPGCACPRKGCHLKTQAHANIGGQWKPLGMKAKRLASIENSSAASPPKKRTELFDRCLYLARTGKRDEVDRVS